MTLRSNEHKIIFSRMCSVARGNAPRRAWLLIENLILVRLVYFDISFGFSSHELTLVYECFAALCVSFKLLEDISAAN